MLERQLFVMASDDERKKDNIDVQISTRYTDIPYLHNFYRQESKDFICALSQSTCVDLFANETIQAIIAHRWRTDFKYLIWAQLVPYILMQVVFIFYNEFVVASQISYSNEQS